MVQHLVGRRSPPGIAHHLRAFRIGQVLQPVVARLGRGVVHGLGPHEDSDGDLTPADPVGRPVDEPLGCVAAYGRVFADAGLDSQHLAEHAGRILVTVRKHVDDGHAVGAPEDGPIPAVLSGGLYGNFSQLKGVQEVGMFFGMMGDLSDTDYHGMGHRHEALPLSDPDRIFLPRMNGSIKDATRRDGGNRSAGQGAIGKEVKLV